MSKRIREVVRTYAMCDWFCYHCLHINTVNMERCDYCGWEREDDDDDIWNH